MNLIEESIPYTFKDFITYNKFPIIFGIIGLIILITILTKFLKLLKQCKQYGVRYNEDIKELNNHYITKKITKIIIQL